MLRMYHVTDTTGAHFIYARTLRTARNQLGNRQANIQLVKPSRMDADEALLREIFCRPARKVQQ